MIKNMILLIICFLLFSCEPAFAAGANYLGFSYLTKTDLMQQSDKKSSVHEVDLSAEFKLSKISMLWMGTGLTAQAVGNNVAKKQDNPSWKDFSLGISQTVKLNSFHEFAIGVSNNFPTGNESRKEEYKSMLSGDLSLKTTLFEDKVFIRNRFRYSYIFNTYESSPTTLQSNPEQLMHYSLGSGVALTKNWSIGIAASVESVQFLNNENQNRNNSSQFIRYSQKNWNLSVSNLIGSYDENDTPLYLYRDDTKQIISMEVEIGFN